MKVSHIRLNGSKVRQNTIHCIKTTITDATSYPKADTNGPIIIG
ncbi:MAG: hypothetical protein ACI30W_02515 [Muribaculaceae bacterium]